MNSTVREFRIVQTEGPGQLLEKIDQFDRKATPGKCVVGSM